MKDNLLTCLLRPQVKQDSLETPTSKLTQIHRLTCIPRDLEITNLRTPSHNRSYSSRSHYHHCLLHALSSDDPFSPTGAPHPIHPPACTDSCVLASEEF